MIPNDVTIQTFINTDNKKELHEVDSIESLIEELEKD